MNDRHFSSRSSLKGFTIVEILLYIGLSGLFLSAMFPFSMNLHGLFAKAGSDQATAAAARIAAEELVSAIRSADGIDAGASSFGTDPGRLVLDLAGTGDQLVVDVDDGTLRFRYGASAASALHGSSARVTSLVFEDRSSADGATRHVDFTLSMEASTALSGRSEYRSAVTIEGGAELRNTGL